jgi:DNA-binding SARP family transcriptional activator
MPNIHLPVCQITAPDPLSLQIRPRLFPVIDELCASPIAWLGGPPGSGKTGVVASYLSARGLRAIWCCVAPPCPALPAVDTALQSLVSALPRGGCLVFEHSHQIPESTLSELLSQWVAGHRSEMHLILIARGDPPASLAPWVAKGVVATLAPSELSFSAAETLELAGHLDQDLHALRQWHEKCAGWPLGIAKALQELRRGGDAGSGGFEVAKQQLFGYFSAEVFEKATREERQLLVCSALAGRISRPLIEQLSGAPDAWAVLERIAGRHWFTTRAAGMPPAYQFTPIFREFLLARITHTLPQAELLRLGSRATALLERDSQQNWLGGSEWIKEFLALRRGNRNECHRVLYEVLTEAHSSPETDQVCAVLPGAVAQLCDEALSADIVAESARHLIKRHGLAPPRHAGPLWPWPFKVHLLGGFRLLKADVPVRFSRRAQRKPFELLQALIAFGGTQVSASALTDALWPDSEGDAAYHALETTLYRLRQLLGSADAVRMKEGTLSLDRQQFWVDVWEFEHAVHSDGTARNAAERWSQIRELYAGHFLEHQSEQPWAQKTRQTLRDRALRCCREAARSYEGQRLWQQAARVYETGLDLDSLSEELYRGLMVCHRELEELGEALRVYRRCCETMTRTLGVHPNAKTQAVYESVYQRAATERSAGGEQLALRPVT